MTALYAPDFRITVRGLTLAADARRAVLSLTCESTLEEADMISVKLADQGFKLADSGPFRIGAGIEVEMGYGGDLQSVLSGEVVAVQSSVSGQGPATLVITGYDQSYRLRHNSPGRMSFHLMNDSLIAAQIAAENLLVPIVDPSPLPPRQSVVSLGSDWALLRELADRNGFDVFVRGDALYFRFPRPQLERVRLELGRNLTSFSGRMSVAGLAGIQVIRGYNAALGEAITAIVPVMAVGGDVTAMLDRLGADLVRELAALGRSVLHDQPVDTPLDAAAIARVILERLLSGLYDGAGTCPGLPQLRAGDQVELSGLGKQFSGVYRLRKVTHTLDDSGFVTRFEVTQQEGATLAALLRKKLLGESPNRRPPSEGLRVGVVETNFDPSGLGRVLVQFPGLPPPNQSAWARVVSPSAGAYFLPDVGDEVAVGFDNGDTDRPYVLGVVWNAKQPPPETNLDQLNRVRVIRTPAGHEIRFDDTAASGRVEVTTAGGMSLRLDDTSPGKIEIDAGSGGSVSIKGKSIEIDAGESVTVKNTKVKAIWSEKLDVS